MIGRKLLVIIIGFCLLPLLLQSLSVLSFPYEVDDSEGVILNQGWLLLQGKPLYGELNEYPLITTIYPPVFPWLTAQLIKTVGLKLLAGRLISLLASLAIIGLLFINLKKASQNNLVPWLSLAFFCSFFAVQDWAVVCRVDMLAICFAFLALTIFALGKNSRLNNFLIILSMLLAVFTKQSMVAVPAAIFLFLVWQKNGRRCLALFLPFIALGALLWGSLVWVTHGNYFNHTVVYLVNPYYLQDALAFLVQTVAPFPFFYGLIFIYVFYRLKQKAGPVLFILYLLTSFLVGLLSGKVGANYNFWLEFCLSSSLLLGLSLDAFLKELKNIKATPLSGQSLLLFLVAVQLLFSVNYYLLSKDYAQTRMDLLEEGAFISSFIQQAPGRILSETAGPAVLNNKEFLFEPFGLSQLVEPGYWDQELILSDIKAQRFSLIALKVNRQTRWNIFRFTPEIIEAIKNNYVRLALSPGWELLKPRFSN